MSVMIESPQNEKLKLVRKLRERKHRDRLGLFVTEGEDLLSAGIESGRQPEVLLSAPGSGLGGDQVAAELLDALSALGSGTRAIAIWEQRLSDPGGPACIYLDGVGDPGNVGAVVRVADALIDGVVVLGPGSADPFSPKATRASMGSVFSQPLARAGIQATPGPRLGLVAHGGEPLEQLEAPLTLCLGAEREGLSEEVLRRCERRLTIPLRSGGAESLNLVAAAAIACERISSPANRKEAE
jgi:TrmH family RNA methyltransferase